MSALPDLTSNTAGAQTPTGAEDRRQRLLLAPIMITPTKALTPSHVKGLLWIDVLYKATSQLLDVHYLWNLRSVNATAQTLEYWEYLDRTVGRDVNYSSWSELELSYPYLQMHAERATAPYAALRPYLEAVECDGYVHPASRRLIDLWAGHFHRLNLFDPGLARQNAPALGVEELVELLSARSLCIDHRRYGGPVMLDATHAGLPLRHAIAPDGQANYLVCVLRELVPMVDRYDRILLVCDGELWADYLLLTRLLCALGANVSYLTIGRVPLDGMIASSRHGGWENYTVDALAERALHEFDAAAFWLGIRIYFIAVLARASKQSLRFDVLHHQLRRAQQIIASDQPKLTDADAVLESMLTDGGYVDPYRLTSSLLNRRGPRPGRSLLERVFV
jgi:hypothetical protein